MSKHNVVSVLPPTSLGYRQGCPHRLAGQCQGKGKEGGTETWLSHTQMIRPPNFFNSFLTKIFFKNALSLLLMGFHYWLRILINQITMILVLCLDTG